MKPIPRHEALQELSRHHHHALRTVLKIKKTVRQPLNDEQLSELREDVRQFWQNGGQEHFREEEEILIPTYARYASPRNEEVIEMLLEHVEIRALICTIEEGEGGVEAIAELGEALEKHVRREERIIFPLVEKTLPDHVIRKLAPYFHEFHSPDECSIE